MTRVIFCFLLTVFVSFSFAGCGGGSATLGDFSTPTNIPSTGPTVVPQVARIDGQFLKRDAVTGFPNGVVLVQSAALQSNAQTNYFSVIDCNDSGQFTVSDCPYATVYFYGWPSREAFNGDSNRINYICSTKADISTSPQKVVLAEGQFITGNPTPAPTSVPTTNPTTTPSPTTTTTPPTTTPTNVPTTLPTPNGAQVVISGLPVGAFVEVIPKVDIAGYNWIEFSPSDKVSGDDHRYRLNFTAPSPIISGAAGASGVTNVNGLIAGTYYNVKIKNAAGVVIGNFYQQLSSGNNTLNYVSGTKKTVRFAIDQVTNTTTERLMDLSKCTVYYQSNDGSSWYKECYWRDYFDLNKEWYVDFEVPIGAGTLNFWLVDRFGNTIGANTVYVNVQAGTNKITIPITDFQPQGDQFSEDPNGVDHFGNGSLVSGGWHWPATSITTDHYFWQKTTGYSFTSSRLVAVKVKVTPDSVNNTENILFRSDVTGASGIWFYRGVREKDLIGNNYVILIFPAEAGTTYKMSQLATAGQLGGITVNWVSIFQVATAVAGDPVYE